MTVLSGLYPGGAVFLALSSHRDECLFVVFRINMGRSSVRGTKKRSQEGLEEKGDEKLSMSPVAHKTKSMSKKTNTKNKRDTSTTSSKRNGRDDFENDDEDNKENDGMQNSLVKQLNDLLEANGFVAEEDVPKDKEALKWKKKYEELYQV